MNNLQPVIADVLSRSGSAGSGASVPYRGLIFEIRREATGSLDLTIVARIPRGRKRYFVGDCHGSAQAADLITATANRILGNA